VDPENRQSSRPSGHPEGKPAKRAYVPPRILSEDLFESKGLACLKVPTGGPEDCSLLFPGSSAVS